MARFTTRITLEYGSSTDYRLLRNLLRENEFETELPAVSVKKITTSQFKTLTFVKQGSIQGTIDSVVKAERKTGKLFSFTVIRKKTV